MSSFLQRGAAAVLTAATLLCASAIPALADGPKVAVMDFGMRGLTGTPWWNNVEPGVALSDLLTDQLVNTHRFTVLDRQNLASIVAEHNLSKSGLVSPQSALQAGRLIGARYLVMGNILQLDQTGGSSVGGATGGLGGLLGGGLSSQRVTLRTQTRVIDVQTGQIVMSFADEQTKKAKQISVGGIGGRSAGVYNNGEFMSSTLGHLINDEAGTIAKSLDPTKFVAQGPVPKAVKGRVIGIDGQDIILNVGTRSGVVAGMYFDVMKTRSIKDPDSGRMLTSSSSVAKIQIMSVTSDTAVGHRMNGDVKTGLRVESELQ